MKIIIGQRGSGRTTKIIEACAAVKNGVIVCPTKPMANYVFQKAKEMGYDIRQPITFTDFCNQTWRVGEVGGFFFDNLDISLMNMAGFYRVHLASIEAKDLEYLWPKTDS